MGSPAAVTQVRTWLDRVVPERVLRASEDHARRGRLFVGMVFLMSAVAGVIGVAQIGAGLHTAASMTLAAAGMLLGLPVLLRVTGSLSVTVNAGLLVAFGVTVPDVFPDRAGANDWVAEEHPAPTIPLRIARLLEISDAAIALPGRIGTLTELVVAWNIGFVARFTGAAPYPLVTVGPTWRDLIEHLSRLLDTDATIVHCAPDVEEAVSEVARRLGL